MVFKQIQQKIQDWSSIRQNTKKWQQDGELVVFTNGCFDLLHYGHLHYLCDAKDCGDRLIVGLNAAASVARLKGQHRPINDELTRQYMLAALTVVDAVVVFKEDTPLNLIKTIMPDILVKGGDWAPEQIVGAKEVIANGGKVLSLPFVKGYSTTNIEAKIIANAP